MRELLLVATLVMGMLQNPWIPFMIGFDPSTALRRVAWPVLELLDDRMPQILTAAGRVWRVR